VTLEKTSAFLPAWVLVQVSSPAEDQSKFLALLLDILHLKAWLDIKELRQFFFVNVDNQFLKECFFYHGHPPTAIAPACSIIIEVWGTLPGKSSGQSSQELTPSQVA
jgi:hypothetical protein